VSSFPVYMNVGTFVALFPWYLWERGGNIVEYSGLSSPPAWDFSPLLSSLRDDLIFPIAAFHIPGSDLPMAVLSVPSCDRTGAVLPRGKENVEPEVGVWKKARRTPVRWAGARLRVRGRGRCARKSHKYDFPCAAFCRPSSILLLLEMQGSCPGDRKALGVRPVDRGTVNNLNLLF